MSLMREKRPKFLLPMMFAWQCEQSLDLGADVLEAHDGVAALKLLVAHPDVILLFTDLKMPRMDGLELAKCAAELMPKLRIALTTAYGALGSGATLRDHHTRSPPHPRSPCGEMVNPFRWAHPACRGAWAHAWCCST